MKLSPHEVDKIRLSNAGYLAQKRLARGIRLVISLPHHFNKAENFSFTIFLVIKEHPRSDSAPGISSDGIHPRRKLLGRSVDGHWKVDAWATPSHARLHPKYQ